VKLGIVGGMASPRVAHFAELFLAMNGERASQGVIVAWANMGCGRDFPPGNEIERIFRFIGKRTKRD